MSSLSVRIAGVLLAAAAFAACARSEATPAGQKASAAGAAAKPGSVAMIASLSDSVSAAADRGRIRGAESAPIWLIEISDFQCPYCKQWHDQSFAAIDREYVQTGKVRLAYLNFPLYSMHKNAGAAAEAAMCASVQNRFWQLHESLFASQPTWAGIENPVPTFDSLAVAAGVAAPAWRECMSSHATKKIIEADHDRSASAGVQSTPTFFIGDRRLEGAYPVDSFRVAIEAALAKARGAR